MAYRVYDNGMPADTSPQGSMSARSKGKGWDNSRFDTLNQAIDYCIAYLGYPYAKDFTKMDQRVLEIILMHGYVYSPAGDMIQIKEEK